MDQILLCQSYILIVLIESLTMIGTNTNRWKQRLSLQTMFTIET